MCQKTPKGLVPFPSFTQPTDLFQVLRLCSHSAVVLAAAVIATDDSCLGNEVADAVVATEECWVEKTAAGVAGTSGSSWEAAVRPCPWKD